MTKLSHMCHTESVQVSLIIIGGHMFASQTPLPFLCIFTALPIFVPFDLILTSNVSCIQVLQYKFETHSLLKKNRCIYIIFYYI